MFKHYFFAALIIVVWIVLHEYTHYVITQEYGCQNVYFDAGVIEFRSGEKIYGFATIGDCSNVEDYDGMNLAQSMVENTGYQLMPFILAITFMMFTLVMKDD